MSFQFKNKFPLIDHENVYEVIADEVYENQDDIILIDVRENEELTGPLGHIKDIKHIPLDQVEQSLSDIPKDETIVFVCAAGTRSIYAAIIAARMGFTDVASMAGGMQLWIAKQFPAIR